MTFLSKGTGYMLLSALWFALMSLFVKLAGERLPSQELVLARAGVTLVLSYVMLKRRGVSPWGTATQRGWLVVRGLLGFGGLSCFYYGLTALPLADVTVIHYLHPVFTALLAAAFLKERVARGLVLSLIASSIGVLLVTRPEFLFGAATNAPDLFAIGAVLLGALFAASAYTVIRYLSRTEEPLVIIFYFPLVAVPLSIPPLVPVALWPTPWEWVLLILIGVTTQLGQIYLTKGLKEESAGRAMSLSYMQIVFAALLGLAFFDEVPGLWTLAGSLLIVAGTYVAAIGSRRDASSRENQP